MEKIIAKESVKLWKGKTMDVPTRIEQENQVGDNEKKGKKDDLPTLSDVDSTDDEVEGLDKFSISTARKDLYESPGCYKMMLNVETQKNLELEVGLNVSQEFPWKRVKFSLLAEHMFDHIDNGEEIHEHLVNYKLNDSVLIGYAPSLVKDDDNIGTKDPFVIYVSEDDARVAAAIIKNIELYERFMMNQKLIKRPRGWLSKGSEYEVDLGIAPKISEVVDVEIQSVYPMKQSKVKFKMRRTSDVRDGYAELVAGDAKFKNVTQQRVHVGVQSSPATVTLEQQTDPTFPSNAWAQYLYEIKEEEGDGLDVSSEEEQEKGKSAPGSKTITPVSEEPKEPKPSPEMSDQIKYLLNTLEFNQIDMYRNDYPLISTAQIQKYTNPRLEEIFCFANISKSNHRYVCAADWYPSLTGIVVTSYTFQTKVTYESIKPLHKYDPIQRTILEPNPVLMWSFTDSLNFKLQFETPREVTSLSFCPYDENVLIGGTVNGQTIIWDLQDRAKNLEVEEHLTMSQAANRELIASFLAWTIQFDESTIVFPAAISSLEESQTEAITEIKWLNRDYYVSQNGRIHENFGKTKSRYFATVSIDGSIAYWSLDFDIGKAAKAAARKNLPAELTQNVSSYKKLDRLFKPVYMVTYPEPLSSIICDTANFRYTPQINELGLAYATEVKTYPIVVEELDQKTFRNSLIVGSFFGRIEALNFEGVDSNTNKEPIATPTHSFARVHDGPIVALEQNPFYPEIFVSIGRTVMAIWREDFHFTPIMWRVRPKTLTAVKWSTDKPAVFFLACIDGSFEAWDLLSRDDAPCLTEVLGGGIVTFLSEHRAAVPKKVISIGDYNSSFRMVALPEGFYKSAPNELELLQAYVEKEINRKKAIQNWQENWCKQNADLIEERKKAEAEAAKDLERLRAEAEEAKRVKETPEDKRAQSAAPSAAHFDYIEKLDKKWDELNLKRMMHNLMTRKKVDPEKLDRETALEKERLRYEERKKESIKAAVARVSEEIAAVRARLLPVEKENVKLSDTVECLVNRVLIHASTYEDIEKEAQQFLETTPPIPSISADEIQDRCIKRRELLNKALGVSYERVHFYEEEKAAGRLKEWDFGYTEFLQSLEDHTRNVKEKRSRESVSTLYTDVDLVPEKEPVQAISESQELSEEKEPKDKKKEEPQNITD